MHAYIFIKLSSHVSLLLNLSFFWKLTKKKKNFNLHTFLYGYYRRKKLKQNFAVQIASVIACKVVFQMGVAH